MPRIGVVDVKFSDKYLDPAPSGLATVRCRRVSAAEAVITDAIVNMRGLAVMRKLGWPVIIDATRRVQTSGGLENASDGQPCFVAPLAVSQSQPGWTAFF